MKKTKLRRPGTQPTEADPTLDIGAKRARVEGEDGSSTQVQLQLRARTRACKSACTCHAHTLTWLLLWLSMRRGSSLPQRDVSAAKTPLGVAAPGARASARLSFRGRRVNRSGLMVFKQAQLQGVGMDRKLRAQAVEGCR
eukprot:scaffold4448_cov115-Isochrysis_galbana.AAC.10